MTLGLFDSVSGAAPRREAIGDGAVLLRAFALDIEDDLRRALDGIVEAAPFRNLITPGGYRMSVAMTNTGHVGWLSDLHGYRYAPLDPETAAPWPPLPNVFLDLAARAAAQSGFPGFVPDSCLVNRYEPGARLSLHQDRDERDFSAPIVSVSLGLPATFLFGGLSRKERPRRIPLDHGDVVVWGGASRLAYHGVEALAEGEHRLFGRRRINLTFRKAL